MTILSQKVIAKLAESTKSQHTLKLESPLPNLGQDSQLQQKLPLVVDLLQAVFVVADSVL
ncbi:MAG: hypothetical protein F6K28_32690 [Microcoleus sp. SIO2G3]|nr:hypothetical protein [Microcoleus sp. SIO2G3]